MNPLMWGLFGLCVMVVLHVFILAVVTPHRILFDRPTAERYNTAILLGIALSVGVIVYGTFHLLFGASL